MDTNIFRSAENKKFSEFSDAVKQELKNKLGDNKTVKSYNDDFERIQQMKTVFQKINNDFGAKDVEPVVDPTDPVDPEPVIDPVDPE